MNLVNIAVLVVALILMVVLAIYTGGVSLPFALPAIAVLLSRLGVKV